MHRAVTNAAAVYIMAADPIGDMPNLNELLNDGTYLVVQELFITPTAEFADVILPAMSFVEREGTFTSGERRVQRFYPAVLPYAESRADWDIVVALAQALGIEIEAQSAAMTMSKISQSVDSYADIDYQALAKTELQWPYVGGKDLYFGGTAFENTRGLGVQLALGKPTDFSIKTDGLSPKRASKENGLVLVPITKLYDHGTTVVQSNVLQPRLAIAAISVNPDDAQRMGLANGAMVDLQIGGRSVMLPARVEEGVPVGMVLLPRSMGIPLADPTQIQLKIVAEGETA
jgi:NADH-quinone oxidoreductase subunit G